MTRMFQLLFLIAFSCSSLAGLTLQEVLKKEADALGGLAKLRGITSYAVTADIEVGGMKGNAATYFQAPDKYRVDLSLPMMGYSQGCSGDDCWMKDNQGLVHSLGADLKRMLVTQSVIDKWDYTDSATFNGVLSLLDGTQKIDSFECYVIKIEPKGGAPARLFVDQASFLPRQVAMTTEMGEVFTRMSDYRPVAGILIPFRNREMSDAGFISAVSIVKDVKLNIPLSDTLFVRQTASVDESGLPKGVDSVSVPFELFRNHAYVKVLINGKGPFEFIFDTGAGGTGLNKRLISSLGLERLGATEARGVGGADSAEVFRIDSLTIGDLQISNLSGFAVDFGSIEAAGTKKIDGVVGYDLLSRYVSRVDYESHTLTLYRRDLTPRDYWGDRCPATIDFRVPYVDAVINDSISGRFRLDTGSGSTIDFNSPFVQAHKLVSGDSANYTPVTSVGIGGGAAGKLGVLPSLQLCGNRIDSLFVSYSSSAEGIFAGPNTAGNIGAAVLKRFAVTFDYGREAAYFRKIAAPAGSERPGNMAGLEFSRVLNDIVVSRVLPGRSADGFLLPGDVIVSVDGYDAKNMLLEQIDHLLNGRRGNIVEIEVQRENQVIKVKLMLNELY